MKTWKTAGPVKRKKTNVSQCSHQVFVRISSRQFISPEVQKQVDNVVGIWYNSYRHAVPVVTLNHLSRCYKSVNRKEHNLHDICLGSHGNDSLFRPKTK